VVDAPFSTFGVDVDSASYANVRRCLRDGHQPSLDAVKIEEMINAFTYDYAGPAAGEDTPLQANLEVASAPWAPQHRLVRIGLKAREMAVAERAPANLVLLLDVSGSMDHERKLPLVKEAMRLLLGQLREDDRVAIVTYAGNSGLALPSTPVAQRREITAALDALQPGGSTHGSSGIHLAYDVAKANFVEGGVNRVILCTDGDFNVGTTGLGELERLIAEKAESGVYLTGLGFGTGNYQDDTLATLANHGNGAHGYIDSVREARRLLVEQVTGTLATVAQDVKIQVEFNPAQVAAYRLLGYNDRRLAPEEFNDDTVDAGEIGAGHTVTALYEVVPVGVEVPDNSAGVDALRYQDNASAPAAAHAHELLLVKVRAQPPGGGESRLHQFPLVDAGHGFAEASPDFKFAAAVAAFGLQLRGMPTVQQIAWTEVKDWARSGIVTDPGGYRREFLELVDQATRLSAP
jgi:Ca-activated chloride channel family protein